MKYLYFLIFIFTINVSAYDYEPIELSENKKDLSKEIYLKLEKGHFVKNKDKTNFNERYIKAVLKKLDKNKNYFTADEVNKFLEQSKLKSDGDFDIELAYDLINLYFEKLIKFSKFHNIQNFTHLQKNSKQIIN